MEKRAETHGELGDEHWALIANEESRDQRPPTVAFAQPKERITSIKQIVIG